ncbi:MAG: hypothetical protein A3G11_00615 [Candidatus Lloydbacteria bacterium RIFCSPLOWO2_12_FULL_51_9]|uniref:Uncharacterized protein n=2 Tax=Candidatus Lloydiibacteriota TaxID=1817910 RepID=A0A1G2DTQ7_9BACT|nr:MAG: hypothetical protein A3J08_02570 [Candidatus Lloydbacteria bacterium RIFCSPLOWO2_02_FULL_51_11]OGZ17034.1 MAG: hypothetical protein A3G11_00615 [Candidatus Lloydbacteria bacterium RIFCSPLOWO2_12_FULL_51_9]
MLKKILCSTFVPLVLSVVCFAAVVSLVLSLPSPAEVYAEYGWPYLIPPYFGISSLLLVLSGGFFLACFFCRVSLYMFYKAVSK